MLRRDLFENLLILLGSLVGVAWAAPLCQPSRQIPVSELYPKSVPEEAMSVRALEKLAADGDQPTALNELGVRYGTGRGVKRNSRKSFAYYSKASGLGEPNAQANLAFMYLNGEGTDKNEALAFEWARKSASTGHFRGQEFLGFMLGTGAGVEKNFTEAAYCYLLSARQGNIPAQQSLALIYEQGIGIPANLKEGQRWRERAILGHIHRKPWIDDSPLEGMPPRWLKLDQWVSDLPTDAVIETEQYVLVAIAPPVPYAADGWKRYGSKDEPRALRLSMGRPRFDVTEIVVLPHAALRNGEHIGDAAQRIYVDFEWAPVDGQPRCVRIAKVRRSIGSVPPAIALCSDARDQAIFEIGASRDGVDFMMMMPDDRKAHDAMVGQLLTSALSSFRVK
jgi:hypothetical protein